MLIWSAVACSSAFPFLYAPQQLLARDSRGRVMGFNAQVSVGRMRRCVLECRVDRWADGGDCCWTGWAGWLQRCLSVSWMAAALPATHAELGFGPARALALLCCVQAAGELQRRWRDGSLEEDLPMRGLSEMFNVSEGCLGNIPRGA